MQTNIQSETQKTFRNVLRTETVSLSRHGGWDRRAAPPPITYPVSYLRILHTYRALTSYNDPPDDEGGGGGGGLPASHFNLCSGRLLSLSLSLSLSAPQCHSSQSSSRRRLLKCEKILISSVSFVDLGPPPPPPPSVMNVLDSDECSVDVQSNPSLSLALLSANSTLLTWMGKREICA